MRGHIVDSIFGKELYSEDDTHLGTIMDGAADGLSCVYDHSGTHIGTVMDGGVTDLVFYSDDGLTELHGFDAPLGGVDLYSHGDYAGFSTDGPAAVFDMDGFDLTDAG